MKIKLTEGQMNTHLIITPGILAATTVMGIESHVAYASKFSKISFHEWFRRGYDDEWFRGERFSYNSVAAASSSTAAGSGDDGGHKHKDSAAASSMLLMMFRSVFLCLNL